MPRMRRRSTWGLCELDREQNTDLSSSTKHCSLQAATSRQQHSSRRRHVLQIWLITREPMNEWADLVESILQQLECSEWSSKGSTFGRWWWKRGAKQQIIQHRQDLKVLENNRRRRRRENGQKMNQFVSRQLVLFVQWKHMFSHKQIEFSRHIFVDMNNKRVHFSFCEKILIKCNLGII